MITQDEGMKYEYLFEVVDQVSGLLRKKPIGNYHEVIARRASEGWRFVQIFAPVTAGVGNAPYFELIFERVAR